MGEREEGGLKAGRGKEKQKNKKKKPKKNKNQKNDTHKAYQSETVAFEIRDTF